MLKNTPIMIAAALAVACFFLMSPIGLAAETAGQAQFADLRNRLIQGGIDKTVVNKLYENPQVVFDQEGTTRYFLHREATLNYAQFLEPPLLEKAKAYMKQHESALRDARHRYGVEEAIVTAILLVESRLGQFAGSRPVLNTLSTLAALEDPQNREYLWNQTIKERQPDSRADFEKWALRKSSWAFGELKALIQYINSGNLDPLSLKGSYAGAVGYAQFIPSNLLNYGQDADGDGAVNLYEHEDAINSIANYLKQRGWTPGMNRDQAYRVLLFYNRSKYYANTILDVAGQLAGKTR